MALSSKVEKALAKLSKQDKKELFSSDIEALATALDGVAVKEALKLVKAESKAVKAGNKYYNSAFKASSDKAYAEGKANEAKAATEASDKAEIKNIKANIKAVKAAEKAAAKAGLNAADTKEFVDSIKANADAANTKDIKAITKQVAKKQLSAEDAADKVENIGSDDNGGNGNGGGTGTPGKPGETFMLTKGLDNYVGTDKDDTIIGSISANAELNTWSPLDLIDGGQGRDTLKISSDAAITTSPSFSNVSNVEVIEVSSTLAVTVDTTTGQGIEELNVVQAGGNVDAKAAATTDINVEMAPTATATIQTAGGQDVTVKLTDLVDITTPSNNVIVGKAGNEAAGDVVVEMTGAKATAAATLSGVNVNGGKTISVTQKATSDDSAAKSATAGFTVTQGAIVIAADTATTDITVKQDATVTASAATSTTTAGSAATQSVKFAALKATESITLAGLTFTARKNLTAEEVAKAFSDLAAGTAAALLTPSVTGDTQASGNALNGVYTGATNGWTSAAAQGDTVVFTQVPSGAAWGIINPATSTAPTVTATAAVAGTTTPNADGVLGVTAGVVDITANAAVKTITVDGYDNTAAAATNNIKNTVATTNDALSEINLSNGGGMTIASAAATLNLSLEKVSGAIAFTTAPETLNIKSVGDNNIGTLTAAATKSLNVSGTGLLSAATTSNLAATETIKVTETAGLNLTGANLTALTSVDTTGTTGTVTMSIDGTKVAYAGGAGVDNVTIAGDTNIEKSINLGAGDDTFDMSAVTTAANGIKAGNVIDGGDGIDTLKMDVVYADTATLAAGFKDLHKNFERLELTKASAAANRTIDLDKIGLNNYVTLNGIKAGQSLTLNNLANNATIVLADVENSATPDGTLIASLKDATGSSDVLNVTTTVASANENFGTLQANGVETINLNAVDTIVPPVPVAAVNTATLNINSDAVTTITAKGNSDLVLTLAATTTELATVNASAMTGGLTLDLSGYNSLAGVTVTGGAGNDKLLASAGVNAKADIINGGAGNDIIVAGTNGAILTGGAGNDLFILAGGNKDANTYSTITDFSAGDLLQLGTKNSAAGTISATFDKLTANLNESTAVFTDYVNAAIEQAQALVTAGGTLGEQAVYFNYKGDAYVVVNQKGAGADVAGTFENGIDQIIKLTGINGDNLSFNADQGTVGLI